MTLCGNKVKAARGFLSTQQERRARNASQCKDLAGAVPVALVALGQWVRATSASGGVAYARRGEKKVCHQCAGHSRRRHAWCGRAAAPLTPMSCITRDPAALG